MHSPVRCDVFFRTYDRDVPKSRGTPQEEVRMTLFEVMRLLLEILQIVVAILERL